MQALLDIADTTADADRAQAALMRAAPVRRRLRLAFGLSATAMTLARRAIARAHPTSSSDERGLLFVELHYGPGLARALRVDLARRRRHGIRAMRYSAAAALRLVATGPAA